MTTIKQLLAMPLGYKTGGFAKTIKTAKKKWQVNGKWVHQVLLTDETGDMLADVNIGGYVPLIAGQEIRVVVCEIQATETGPFASGKTKLYVDQFVRPTVTEPPDVMDFAEESAKIIRGKIKTWLVAGCLQSGTPPKEVDRAGIESLVDWVME
jgi:hypothetical protein